MIVQKKVTVEGIAEVEINIHIFGQNKTRQ